MRLNASAQAGVLFWREARHVKNRLVESNR